MKYLIAALLTGSLLLLARTAEAQVTTEFQFGPNDTQAEIQLKLNQPQMKKIVFTPGVYTKVASLAINPANVALVSSYGAKFIYPAAQANGVRLFNVNWSGAGESPHIVFEGGEFDLSEQLQGRVSFNKEHQAAFFLNGANGPLNISLRDISIRNGAGNGIYVYYRTKLSLHNVEINECFRGGLVVGGGANEVIGTDLDLRGVNFRCGLRIEPNSESARNLPSFYNLSHVRTNWFNIQLGKKSAFIGSDLSVEPINPANIPDGMQGYIFNQGGKITINNSSFALTRKIQMRLSGETKFSNSFFRLVQYDAAESVAIRAAIEVLSYYSTLTSEWNRNQRVSIDGCEFRVDTSVNTAISTCYALQVYENQLGDDNNFLLVKNSEFIGDDNFYPVWTRSSARTAMSIKNCVLNRNDF